MAPSRNQERAMGSGEVWAGGAVSIVVFVAVVFIKIRLVKAKKPKAIHKAKRDE